MVRGKRVRRAAHPPRRPVREEGRTGAAAWTLLRGVICSGIFVLLVVLKLVVPGNLAALRGTVGQWLVRDADFIAAFSAVGRAVSGEGGVAEALGEAYLAVLGGQPEAQEAAGAPKDVPVQDQEASDAELTAQTQTAQTPDTEDRTPAQELPAHTSTQGRALSFSYTTPLNGEVTSPFGWREHPVTGVEAFHYGIDIGAEEGAAIVCFADGTVGAVGESTELGKYLTVNHADGYSTLYAHCSAVSVAAGNSVAQGQKIAAVGQTGNATGPHLHFEVHDGEVFVDPAYYLGA